MTMNAFPQNRHVFFSFILLSLSFFYLFFLAVRYYHPKQELLSEKSSVLSTTSQHAHHIVKITVES